jgi:glycine cleavage system H protein
MRYSKDHEWAVEIAPGLLRVGISEYAARQLGDIVFVELPEIGTAVQAGDSMGTIESVKTVSDLYAPASGTVVKVNTELLDRPELVNDEPYNGGWMVELSLTDEGQEDLKGLMDETEYRAFAGS